jgi:hypothetical protein
MPLFGLPNVEKLKAEEDAAGFIKAPGHRKSEMGEAPPRQA